MQDLDGGSEAAVLLQLTHVITHLLIHFVGRRKQLGLQLFHLVLNPPSPSLTLGPDGLSFTPLRSKAMRTMSSVCGFQLVFGPPILYPSSPPQCMSPKCLSPASDAKTTDLYHDFK